MVTDRKERSRSSLLRRDFLKALISSLVLTVAALVAVELTEDTLLRVPGLAVMLLVAPFITFRYGLRSGLISATIVVLYSVYYFSTPGDLFSYTDEDLRRLGVLSALSLVLTLMIGSLQRAVRAAERRLRRQLDFLKAITNSLGQGVCRLDRRGNVTFLNPAAERMLGWREAELLGKNIDEVIYFQDTYDAHRSAEDHPLLEPVRSGAIYRRDDDVFTGRDGRTFPVAYTSAPITEDGQTTGAVVAFQDITERKRVEEELRESEERFRMIVEGVKDYAIFMLDPQGRVASWNEGAQRIKGYEAEEIIGRHFSIFYTEEDLKRGHPEEELRIATTEGVYEEEGLRVRKDGSRFWANVVITALRDEDGELRGFSKVTRDVTERKWAEEELKESEARKAAILEGALDCIISMDEAGRITDFNPAAERTFGYSRDEVLGRELAETIIPPHLRDQHRRALSRFLETGEGRLLDRRLELSGMRADGTEFPAELTITHARFGEEHTFTGFLRDITERRKAEERLSFLAGASTILSSSLGYRETLSRVARLAVPDLADWCAVDVLEDGGSLQRLAVEHEDPEKVSLVRELQERYPPDPDAPYGVHQVLRTGEPELVPEIPESLLEEAARDEEYHAMLRQLGLKSYMIVPLVARGRMLGAISLVAAESGRRYGQADLELAEDLARRAALTVDNARLYDEAQREIVERKRHEETLRERAEELRRTESSLAEAQRIAHIGNWDYDVAEDEAYWSDELFRIFGFTPQEFVFDYKTFLDSIHPDDRNLVRKAVRKALYDVDSSGIDYRIVRPDGEVRVVHTEYETVRDSANRPAKLVGTIQDITEQKRAEEVLRTQSEYLASLHETTLGLIERLDPAHLLRGILDRAGTLMGTPHGYIFLTNVDETVLEVRVGAGLFSSFVGRRIEPGEGLAGRVFEAGEPLTVDDYSVWAGRLGFVPETIRAMAGVPLRSGGRVTGVLALSYADQERRFGEQEMALLARFADLASIALDNAWLYDSAQRELAARKQTERELAELVEELRRSNAELEQFAYVASHDLQEPLRMVSSFTQLLARRYKGKLDADADEFIDYVVDGASRMQILINDLLIYSRVGTRGKELVPTDTEAVFDAARANLRRVIEESGAEVTSGELPTVIGDDVQLMQLFQNLIGNAIKFRSEEPPEVRVEAERQDGRWLFSVSDNGIGIEPEYLERIFVIFQRLHGRTEYSGTGIGLAVCKKIVERHGGKIWVESEPGEGSTFYFTLRPS